MPIAPLLQRFVDDELALAPMLIERTQAGTVELLRAERVIVDALQSNSAAYRQAFIDALAVGVRDALQEQLGNASWKGASGGLELMDESRVEIDIEISRAMQLIDTTAEWEQRELQTFTSTLIGQTHVSAESNPFRPQVYASALWQAACAASPVPVQRITLLRVSSGVAAGLLKNAWGAACSRLESQGVEPGIYRSIVIPAGAIAGRGPAPTTSAANAPMSLLLAAMPGGSATVQVGVGNAAIAMGSEQRVKRPMSAEFEQALAQLDEVLRQATSSPGGSADTSAAAAQRIEAQRAALVGSAGTAGERQIVELTSRLFDALLTDADLPTPFVPVLARLRASALRVALLDPDMLGSTQHPVWQLIDRIGAAALANPHASDPRSAVLLSLCQSLSEQLASAKQPDAALFRRALVQLDTLLSNQTQAQLQAAQATVQALQQSEQRELLEQRLSQRLAEQLVTVRTTPTVRRFMVSTWAKVLAESIQREGETGESTRGYIKLVDELVWSVQLPDHPKSRQRLITLLPSILQRLRAGMQLIGLPAAERESVLDELVAIHAEALRPSAPPDTAALTSEQIVQRMRDEVLPATTGYGGFSDSVIDLASMETVPASLLPDDSGTAGPDAQQRIEALRAGERLRVFLHGRWGRVQLVWRSDQSLFFLFASEVSGRTHSVTRRALERLAGAGLVQAHETRPLVQRALDVVTRDASRLNPK